jgi:uncharacterized protein YfbU (UPF0304 family)
LLFGAYELLESDKISKNEAKRYHDILLNGYEAMYDDLSESLGYIPRNVCNEVYDILHMFVALHDSYLFLEEKSGIKENDIIFKGFDGTEERDYYRFTKYLIEM